MLVPLLGPELRNRVWSNVFRGPCQLHLVIKDRMTTMMFIYPLAHKPTQNLNTTNASRQLHDVPPMEWVTTTQSRPQTSGLEGRLVVTRTGVNNVFQPHPSVQVVSPPDLNSPR
jgi:hypothetical protein